MKKIVFVLGLLLINLHLSSQITLTNTLTPATVNTCDSGLFEFKAILGTAPDSTDSVTFMISLPSGVEFAGVFSSSVGTLHIRSLTNDTANITIDNFPPATTSFYIQYYSKPGCNNFQASTQNVFNQIQGSYLSNTSTLNSPYSINSGFLNFVGIFTPTYADPFIPYNRRFVFHNTGNVPFVGDITFLDTLFNTLNQSGVGFDTAQITNPIAFTILNSQISDSSVYLHVHISNLAPGDSIVFEETLTLFNCNRTVVDNQSWMQFFYGCTGETAQQLCAQSPNIAVNTSIAPNPAAPQLALDMLDPNQLLGDITYSCPNTDDLRIIRIINNGGGTDSLLFTLFKGGNHLGEIGYFDTNEVKVFHYVGSTIQYLPITGQQTINYSPGTFSYDLQTNSTPDQYLFKVGVPLNYNDSIFVEYRDKNFCIGSPSFPRVFNQPVISHSLRFFASAKVGCNNTWTYPSDMEHTTSRGAGSGIIAQKFSQTQFFQNFSPYLNDLQESWYDVINVTPLQMNGNHPSFMDEIFLDPSKCQLVYELDIDSGITLVQDSIYLLSQQSSGNVILFPTTIIDTTSGGLGGTIKAIFDFPSNFFDPNTVGVHVLWGSHWIKSNAYDQFFSNSSLHFRLKAHCPLMPYDSKAEITERALFVYDNTCGSGCEFPLAEKESVINLLCPGCKIPGWNVSQVDVQRTNFGFTDVDNNNRPDQVIPVLANASTSEEDRVTYGDTIEVHMKSFVSDGDSILFSNIGFPFKYGWLEFKGQMVPNIQYIGGSGTWRGSNINLPSSLSYANLDSILIDISPSSLQPFVTNLLDTMYWAGDTMDITMQFVVSSNLVFSGDYITMQQIDCKQYMSGIERTNPAIAGYAGPDAEIIAPLTPAQRKNYYYWCTGNGGSLLAFGNNFSMYPYGSAYGQYFFNGPTVQDYCYKQIQANLGNKVGQQHVFSNSLDVTNQFALNSFQYEIRDFMQIDSISFTYPSQSYFVDSIYIYQYNLRSDIQTYNTNYTNSILGQNYFVYPSNLGRFSGDTVVIYPKAITQYLATTGHPFFEADTLSRGDESKVLVPTLFLKMIDYCSTPEQVNVSSNEVTAWLSNMPVQGGSVVLTDSIHGEAYFSDDFVKPAPSFTYSATPIPLIANSNPITWNFSMQVNNEPTTSTLSSHEAIVKSFSPNNFIGAYSPSGNITVTSIVPNSIPAGNLSVYSPITISPLPIAYKIGHLDPSSGLLTFFVNATFNCANITGIDSLYVITGYNCYGYPTNLTNVCGLDTTVLYLQPSVPGIEGIVSSPDSISPCDTMDIEIELTITGQGNIPQCLANLNLPSTTQYITGSGELSFVDNSSTITIGNFDPVAGQWDFNSVSQLSSGVDQTNNPVILKFKVRTLCNYNLEPVTVDISAVTYCQQPINFSLTAVPTTLLPSASAIHDSIVVTNFVCDPFQLTYDIAFPLTTQFANSIFLQAPPPFLFASNLTDTMSVHYNIGTTGSYQITVGLVSGTGTYPCGNSVTFDLFVLTTEKLQCSPLETPCTSSNVVADHLTCSFNFDIPVAAIIAGACTGGCTPLTGQVTGGTSPYQYLWTNLTTSTNISTTINANACPTSSSEDFQFQVTDGYGCTDTATITVVPCCILPSITCNDTVIQYNQELCNSPFIPDTPIVNSTCPLVSLQSDWPGGPFPWGVTTVTWTATDQFGNTATCQQLVTYDPTILLMSYTILAGQVVGLGKNNDVLSGAVGVQSASGGASFNTNCSVNGPGHFVKAPTIVTLPAANPNIPVAFRFFSPANVISPPFLNNMFSGPTMNLSGTVTLPAGNYGIINIAANSNVTVTGDITCYRLMVNGHNATITFNQTTNVIVSERINCANFTSFNPTLENVKVYVGGFSANATDIPTIKIGPRCDIYAFLFTPNGRLHVEDGIPNDYTLMTGQFLARYVTSDKRVEWNAAPDCSSLMMQMMETTNPNETINANTFISGTNNDQNTEMLLVSPNPTSWSVEVKFVLPYNSDATLTLYDGNGKQVAALFKGTVIENELQRVQYDVSTLASGMYYLILDSKGEPLFSKLIVVPE